MTVSNVFGKDFKDNLLIFLKYSSLSLKMALKIEYMLKFSCHITLWFLHIYMLWSVSLLIELSGCDTEIISIHILDPWNPNLTCFNNLSPLPPPPSHKKTSPPLVWDRLYPVNHWVVALSPWQVKLSGIRLRKIIKYGALPLRGLRNGGWGLSGLSYIIQQFGLHSRVSSPSLPILPPPPYQTVKPCLHLLNE